MSDASRPLDPEEWPLPMGIYEDSGAPLPPLDPRAFLPAPPPDPALLARGGSSPAERLAVSDVDPNRLSDAGWGIVFPAGANPAIRSALEPLIARRREQALDTRLFRIFEGEQGYRPGQDVRGWLRGSGVGFATVDPLQGVPLYLTLVGSPREIPFEFQYMLDSYWNVGRLSFDRLEDYAAYAERVVAYETATALPQRKTCAIFATRTPGDRPTTLLHDVVARALVDPSATPRGALGARQGFGLQPLLGAEATKSNLLKLLQGELGGVPALLFSGSHGLAVQPGAAEQLDRQGAIVCQDWESGPVAPAAALAGDDLPTGLRVDGLIHFLFACYGGGCPEFDAYALGPDGKPPRLAQQPFVARLPQRLLAAGALAVLAHVDRAWSYSFLVGRSVPQVQEFREVLALLMRGERIGQAADKFNMRWCVLGAELTEAERTRRMFPDEVSQAVLANRWIAYTDARNYLIFGDPAVRLRVEDMPGGAAS